MITECIYIIITCVHMSCLIYHVHNTSKPNLFVFSHADDISCRSMSTEKEEPQDASHEVEITTENEEPQDSSHEIEIDTENEEPQDSSHEVEIDTENEEPQDASHEVEIDIGHCSSDNVWYKFSVASNLYVQYAYNWSLINKTKNYRECTLEMNIVQVIGLYQDSL